MRRYDGAMRSRDPADLAIKRLEARRFGTRADNQMRMIERADSMRELSRLASLPIPANLHDVPEARNAQQQVELAALQRARDLIQEQIQAWSKVEADFRDKFQSSLTDEWAGLTGLLASLKGWAARKLAEEQQKRD